MSGRAAPPGGRLRFRPLSPARWDDLVDLFGRHGACDGCWCMYWRITRAQFARNRNSGNRRAFKRVVDAGEVPGILGYLGRRPVAWCSIAPRKKFASLNRSPVLKPIDDTPVWSIVCFYVARDERGNGRLPELVRGAVDHARRHGARMVEAYPRLSHGHALTPESAYMGLVAVFEQAGFETCARPGKARLIMRCALPH